MKPYALGGSFSFFLLTLAALLSGCATKGLLTERYEPDFYRIPCLLQEARMSENPTFIVYGDTQPAWRIYDGFIRRKNWLTWKMLLFPFYELYWLGNGVVGTVNFTRHMPDYGRKIREMMRNAVYAEFQRSSATFILNTGDIMGQDGRRVDHWALFLQENKHQHPLLNEVPYLPTIGNHERANDQTYGRPNYEAVFEYPFFYTLQFPDVTLFVVDSSVIMDQKQDIEDEAQDELFEKWFVSSDPDRPAWLERELDRCSTSFKVVSMHHPPLSFGHHWKDWFNPAYGPDAPQKRRRLLHLFCEHGVQVIFSGHDHVYQHNVLRYSSKEDSSVEVIHGIVSSGGGAPMRDPRSIKHMKEIQQHYLSEGLEVEPLMQEDMHHYCLVHVNSSEMRIQTFGVTPDTVEHPVLLEEVIIPKPEIEHAAGRPIGAVRSSSILKDGKL